MPRVVSKMSIQVPKRPPGLGAKGVYEISGFRKRFATTITGGKESISGLYENLILGVHSTCPGTKEAGQVIPLAIASNVINIDSTHFYHLLSFEIWPIKKARRFDYQSGHLNRKKVSCRQKRCENNKLQSYLRMVFTVRSSSVDRFP